ncbi:hypothetical protein [Xanthomonas citri]|uniref:hypothetical protein n=1 Tax=Xanthomonas citri TaxID=346 RepID=UPI000C7D2131|nr:hypothetical protein [Xanthomonas citri]
MIMLLEVFFFILLFPFMVVGVALRFIAEAIRTIFNVPLLALATWLASAAILLANNANPDPDRLWITPLEQIASAQVGGFQAPVFFALLAATALTASALLRVWLPVELE